MTHILVCDERGTTRWPSPTKTWALGGFIISNGDQAKLLEMWAMVKHQLCGTDGCELKWSHFFVGNHQARITNPLLATDPQIWRKQAKWALTQLFNAASLVPITTYVRKDKVSDTAFLIAGDDRKVLNIDVLWVSVIVQFALYLSQHQSTGEIWFDQLGSRQEEARKQSSWEQLRDGNLTMVEGGREILQRVALPLRFLDSSVEPIVQIADFVSGILWAASEGDDEFLLRSFAVFFPLGASTYTLLRIT